MTQYLNQLAEGKKKNNLRVKHSVMRFGNDLVKD